MAWTTPRSWTPGEFVTAALMNTHVRDNFSIMSANMDDDGSLRDVLKQFGASSGQGNGAGSVDTELTSFGVTVPANFLSQPGDALLIEQLWSTSGTAGTKVGKVSLGSSALSTIFSFTNVSSLIITSYQIIYRTPTSAAITGYAFVNNGAGGAVTTYMRNQGLTVDFTSAMTLKCYANAGAASELILGDHLVGHGRGVLGSLI